MKKIITPITALALTVSTKLNSAFAAGQSFWDKTPNNAIGATAQGDLVTNVQLVINYFLGVLGLVAVAFLIYAGILMVTAGGEEDNIGKAKKIITYAAIGIVIIVLSYTIVQFVTSVLQ